MIETPHNIGAVVRLVGERLAITDPAYAPGEEPFHSDPHDWMPGHWGAQPERMLP